MGHVGHPVEAVGRVGPVIVGSEASNPSVAKLYNIIVSLVLLLFRQVRAFQVRVALG